MQRDNFWKEMVKESAVLDPVDRSAEILFGLIMVLTFTGTISITTSNRNDVMQLLWAALGCNLAWGLVDAIMYLMTLALERGHSLTLIKNVRGAENDDEIRQLLKGEIEPMISGLLSEDEIKQLCIRVKQLPEPSSSALISMNDLLSSFKIFLLVFLSTFPVAIPFGIFDDLPVAMRTSNAVALLLLFIAGYVLGKYAGFRPVITGILYTIIGLALVAITMALGG